MDVFLLYKNKRSCLLGIYAFINLCEFDGGDYAAASNKPV